jgi:hypothetical protein
VFLAHEKGKEQSTIFEMLEKTVKLRVQRQGAWLLKWIYQHLVYLANC